MAGSFNLFRQYQKLALAALAIMAMLAFFVLPPLLQMGSGGGTTADRQVVSWKGGGLTESGLQREMVSRRALNQFLMALRAAATGEERVQQPLPDNEAAVVETLVLAKEAEANGIVVSDAVVNSFLSNWTGDMVTAEQIEGVIEQLKSRVGVTETGIFDGLRSLILGRYVQEFAIRGVDSGGAPPGWQWDDFRRLEHGATVEVVPVVAEQLIGDVPEPSAAALQAVYDTYKDDLPRARSASPGFKEPARVRYDMLVAGADMLVAESVAEVTDEAIGKFYDENKESMFARPAGEQEPAATDSPGDAPAAIDVQPAEPEIKPADGDPPTGNAAEEPAMERPADTDQEPAAKPADEPAPKTEPEGDEGKPAVEPAAAEGARRVGGRVAVRTVSLLQERSDEAQQAAPQPASAEAPPASQEAANAVSKPEDAAEPSVSEQPAAQAPAAAGDGEATPTTSAEAGAAVAPAGGTKPLAEVKEEIRSQLARDLADRKLGEVFDKIAGRIATYAEELDLATAVGTKPPAAPDLDAMAREFGLDSLRSELVTASEAVAGGGIGASFQLAYSERFGVRQQRWIDMMFADELPLWRPFVTRDIAGNRYLSWKTAERAEFTPPFAEVRDEVERVWRLMEARPLAKKRAEQIVADAGRRPLAEAVAGQQGLEATTAGPFTWLTRGTAPFGSAPILSDPAGVQMAGESFMQAVFSLEPGEATVAFNEPETVCYAVRLVSLEPGEDTLRERFLDSATDPRRTAAVAEADARTVYARWLDDVRRRQGVEWKRPPR
jgi:hypothetical protein